MNAPPDQLSALRTMVLTRERYIWLRTRLCSFVRMRFWADLVFAKVTILPYNVALYNVQHLNAWGLQTPRPSQDYFATPA